MNRMDRMVLGEVLGWFVGSVFLFSSLILASGELVRLAMFLQNGQSLWLVLQLLGFTLPQIFALTFPIAMLLATLMGIGRLSSDSELVALVAAGISFERIMLPISVFGLMVSLVGVWFTNSVVPASSAARNQIIKRVEKEGNISLADRFNHRIADKDSGNVLVVHSEGGASIGKEKAGAATLRNLSIEYWQKNALQYVIYAERADWVIGTREWALDGVRFANLMSPEQKTQAILSGGKLQTRQVALGKPDELAALRDVRTEDVSTPGLRERSRVFKANGDLGAARDAEVEGARRIALPFASFIFALVGAPLGVWPPRSGKGNGFAIAIMITFLYWTLLQMFTVIGRGGTLPPQLAVMIPNLMGLAAGIYLIRRVTRS
ncbi:MAG: LptF/LptG family permease [Armatimonadota bacterium]